MKTRTNKQASRRMMIEFCVGPRKITAVYNCTRLRIVLHALIQDGRRINREAEPELWQELRGDFISLVNKS